MLVKSILACLPRDENIEKLKCLLVNNLSVLIFLQNMLQLMTWLAGMVSDQWASLASAYAHA